jgi:mannose-6-phosphate isomerase-like protein (cupin superfamily)
MNGLFIVVEGRLQMTIVAAPTELEPGATAYVTGSVPRTFRNPAGHRTRCLLICSPGGMDYFRGIATGNAALV